MPNGPDGYTIVPAVDVLKTKEIKVGKMSSERGIKKFRKESHRKNYENRPGPPVFSQEGIGLKRTLSYLNYRGVKVFPANSGPLFNSLWECHVMPMVTGFSVRFRINGRNREGVVILAPQDKLLRREIEGAVNAWWQALLPSDVTSPEL